MQFAGQGSGQVTIDGHTCTTTCINRFNLDETVTVTFERLPAGADYAITVTGSLAGSCDVEQVPAFARPASAELVGQVGTTLEFEVTLLGGGTVVLVGSWWEPTKLALANGPRSCLTPTGCTPSTECYAYSLSWTFAGVSNDAFTGTWSMYVRLDPRCGTSCALDLPISGAR